MKTSVLAASVGLAVLTAWPLGASAEHNSVESRQSAEPRELGPFGDLDLGLRIAPDGFSLSGRVFRPEGVFGAWLNGRLRRDGLSLDGRVQEGDRARNFRLDLDLWEGSKH